MVMEDFSSELETALKSIKDIPFDFEVTKSLVGYNITIMVDWSKMDKNSPNYDPKYRELFLPTGAGMFQRFSAKRFEKYFTEMMHDLTDVLGFNTRMITYGYHFINYEYLEKFEPIIQEAINGTSCPDTIFEFEADWDSPEVKIIFASSNFSPLDNSTHLNYKKFQEELKINLSGILDLSSYSLGYRVKK